MNKYLVVFSYLRQPPTFVLFAHRVESAEALTEEVITEWEEKYNKECDAYCKIVNIIKLDK